MSWVATQGTTEFDLICGESGGNVIGQGVTVSGLRAVVRSSAAPRVLTKFQSSLVCRYTYIGVDQPSVINGAGGASLTNCSFGSLLVPSANSAIFGLGNRLEAERVQTPSGLLWRATGQWFYSVLSATSQVVFAVTLTQYSQVNASCPIGLDFVFNDSISPPARFRGYNGNSIFDFTPSNLTLAGRFVFA